MCYKYVYGTDENPERKYYYRFRRGDFAGAEQALSTRFTYELGRRPCKGPRGGQAILEFPRAVYYAGGRFFKHVNAWDDDLQGWRDAYEPITGTIWDAHPKQAKADDLPRCRLSLENGFVKAISCDGESVNPELWPLLADELKLNKKPRKAPAKH